MQQLNRELLDLTHPFINRADQVQGPGGNTSVKGTNGEMMIKASGFRFEEINQLAGFSVVNYKNIQDYFHHVKITDKEKEEKVSVAFVLDNVLKDSQGVLFPKPSMETGFHAVLDKYVVHTHSVWSNLVNCSIANEELVKQVRKQTGISIAQIPYISPGFGLSYLITQVVKDSIIRNEKTPRVFFLVNHGIIAHGNTIVEAKEYLSEIDEAIKRIFSVRENYPKTDLLEKGQQDYQPSDSFVNRLLVEYKVDNRFFNRVLFPDQTVFFKDQISFDGNDSQKKIRIDNSWKISYHTNEREAKSIHETMTAYMYINDSIVKSGQVPQFIPEVELDYIHGMDMEKHRKSLME
jgi:rhamnose utilization protein RhaD (predicted bifunctional aldolase and dehydrogenase)